ncbi:hypothetical protein CEUSTIGMA_g10162.t1 [Chlamydomonas eustigma]|uniref:Uncharacterized protein n=1 Tax=Chlamydomonas eustigma TaxID=1157962 RepID=A0A250XIA1_9CHLO|nr:hypothetical protein CEUSTIGMA_g10162.t1 [Chlamydomonas eustigma]|eukprot:GAX82736.1 hypothetical protein CEUSTIGMA_g10162.t1 [Chlamydomonas eustigma]
MSSSATFHNHDGARMLSKHSFSAELSSGQHHLRGAVELRDAVTLQGDISDGTLSDRVEHLVPPPHVAERKTHVVRAEAAESARDIEGVQVTNMVSDLHGGMQGGAAQQGKAMRAGFLIKQSNPTAGSSLATEVKMRKSTHTNKHLPTASISQTETAVTQNPKSGGEPAAMVTFADAEVLSEIAQHGIRDIQNVQRVAECKNEDALRSLILNRSQVEDLMVTTLVLCRYAKPVPTEKLIRMVQVVRNDHSKDLMKDVQRLQYNEAAMRRPLFTSFDFSINETTLQKGWSMQLLAATVLFSGSISVVKAVKSALYGRPGMQDNTQLELGMGSIQVTHEESQGKHALKTFLVEAVALKGDHEVSN